MFASLNGRVDEAEEHALIIEVGGIGFRVFTTDRTARSQSVGDIVKLYIHESVREDAFDLYGFLTREERTLFLQLIGVSGVGPKAALAILSTLRPSELSLAVAQSDAKRIAAAPGVGPKLAQRIALELKDKLAPATSDSMGEAPLSALGNEALAALMSLGFSAAEARDALATTDESASTGERVRQALSYFNKR